MLVPMQPALALLLIGAAAIMTPPDPGKARLPRHIAAVPMTWHIERNTGSASGQRLCSVISLGGDVSARLLKEGPAGDAAWSVAVGFDSQPGSLGYLRVNRKYYTTDKPSFRGAEAAEIVALLKSPGEFVFEWAQRPDHAKRGGLFGTGDFAAKAATCELWIDGTRV